MKRKKARVVFTSVEQFESRYYPSSQNDRGLRPSDGADYGVRAAREAVARLKKLRTGK